MQDIILLDQKQIPLVDSRLMASRLDVRHRDMMRDVMDKYAADFEEFGSFARNLAKPEGGGRPQPYYLLNENQCYLLLTYIKNTPRARKLKQSLVQAFSDVRQQLAALKSERLDGKEVRKLETQAIAEMVEYAKAQGSKSAELYYANITKMTNSALGIAPGTRDQLASTTLRKIKLAETMVDIAIRDGLKNKLHYKDIYKDVKARVLAVVPMLEGAK
ncbi:MAG: Rha family transcriptional regulator [Methyloprofundus sp.]|nr:Rha family transcriptional regulator [Methyloprofundus sp.]